MTTQFDSLIRANVKVSNANDTASAYTITAEAQVANGNVENFNNGQVLKGEMYVATFNRWSAQNLNVTFNNVEAEEQCAILAEINAFIRDVEALVLTNPITI
jgi:hypothetical protein